MSEDPVNIRTKDNNDESAVRSTRPRDRTRRRRSGDRTAASQLDNSVPSPCVSVCQFNGEPFCRGCYRNIDEIREWMIMSKEQKLAVLELVTQRRMEETGEQLW